MINIILLIIIGLIFVGVVTFVTNQKKEPGVKKEKIKEDIGKYYYLKKSLFTPTEYVFYQELVKQNNNQYIIHSKVRLEDIVRVAKGVGNRFREMRNHIKSRHVDFVLVGGHGEVVAVIELDDKSHDTEKAKIGDEIKNQIFEFNKVKFYRVRVGENYIKKINEILIF
jgi:hypothetical protein